jgi:hypothetical protein
VWMWLWTDPRDLPLRIVSSSSFSRFCLYALASVTLRRFFVPLSLDSLFSSPLFLLTVSVVVLCLSARLLSFRLSVVFFSLAPVTPCRFFVSLHSSLSPLRLFRLLRLFRFFRLHSRPRLGYPVSILRFVTLSLSSLSRFRTRTLLSRLCRCRFFSVVRPRPFVVLDSCCCLLTSHCCLFRCGSLFTCRCCCLLHLIVRLCHVSVLCFRCFVVSFVVSCLSSLLFGRWVWICLTVGLWSWILCYWIAL